MKQFSINREVKILSSSIYPSWVTNLTGFVISKMYAGNGGLLYNVEIEGIGMLIFSGNEIASL